MRKPEDFEAEIKNAESVFVRLQGIKKPYYVRITKKEALRELAGAIKAGDLSYDVYALDQVVIDCRGR